MNLPSPFDRPSFTSNAHSNAPANGHSIACHRPFHRWCSITPHPRSDGTLCSAQAALAYPELRCELGMSDEICGRVERGKSDDESDGKIKRDSRLWNLGPKYLSAHCFDEIARSTTGYSRPLLLFFSGPSGTIRDAMRGKDCNAYPDASISTLLYDLLAFLLCDSVRIPIVVPWHATRMSFAFVQVRPAIAVVLRQAHVGPVGSVGTRRAFSVRFIRQSVVLAVIPIMGADPEGEAAALMRAVGALRLRKS